jgi:hypothetical protein
MLANMQNRRHIYRDEQARMQQRKKLPQFAKNTSHRVQDTGSFKLHTRKLSIFQFRKKMRCITESKPRSMNVDYLRDYQWARYFCTIRDKRCAKTDIENTTARDKNTL